MLHEQSAAAAAYLDPLGSMLHYVPAHTAAGGGIQHLHQHHPAAVGHHAVPHHAGVAMHPHHHHHQATHHIHPLAHLHHHSLHQQLVDHSTGGGQIPTSVGGGASPTMLVPGSTDFDPDYLRSRFMYGVDLQQMATMASLVHQPTAAEHALRRQHESLHEAQHVGEEAASPGIPGSSVNYRGSMSSPKESVADSPIGGGKRGRKRRTASNNNNNNKREQASRHPNGDASDSSASSGDDADYAPIVGKEKEVPKVKKRRVRKTWTERFEQLKEFRNRFGHCKVPKGWAEDPKLARWVCNMRQSKRMGKMKPERVRKLEELGFLWRCEQSGKLIWEEMLSKLQNFQQRYGHTHVPKRWPEDDQLSAWIVYIRQRQRVGTLSPEKVRELDRIGFVWEDDDDTDEYADDTPRMVGQPS